MPNENREQTWEHELQARHRLFQDVKFMLGTQHAVDEGKLEDCGPNCVHRLKSITCPYFKPTVPCLVGCEVQQRIGVPGEGIGYEEFAIRVIAQAGSFLIGEEVILNLSSPSAEFLRILTDKAGNPVGTAIARKDVSLFSDLQPGIFISQVEVKDVEQRDQSESGE